MARPLPATYRPFGIQSFLPGEPVREGSTASLVGELDLVENQHFAMANLCPPWVLTLFNGDTTNYVDAANAVYEVRATWRRRVFRDLTQWYVNVWYDHGGAVDPANDAFAKFQLTSDNTKSVEIRLVAGSTAWTRAFGTFNFDPAVAGSIDTVEMLLKKGAAGTARVRSVTIWPAVLGSIAAGVTTDGVVPFDTGDCSANDPLSTWMRNGQIANCEILRKTRPDTIVGWSDDALIRTPNTNAAYKTTSATYVTQAIIPFRSRPGENLIEWSLFGYRAGASGSVRLRTGYMIDKSITAIEQALGNAATWATPYSGAKFDSGVSTLTCLADADDFIEVALKGDGADRAFLMGLNCWFKDIA